MKYKEQLRLPLTKPQKELLKERARLLDLPVTHYIRFKLFLKDEQSREVNIDENNPSYSR